MGKSPPSLVPPAGRLVFRIPPTFRPPISEGRGPRSDPQKEARLACVDRFLDPSHHVGGSAVSSLLILAIAYLPECIRSDRTGSTGGFDSVRYLVECHSYG